MNSELAINTIKESCYQVGYPTHNAAHERRELINQSCDYAIECINKLDKIKRLVSNWNDDAPWVTNEKFMHATLLTITGILEQE